VDANSMKQQLEEQVNKAVVEKQKMLEEHKLAIEKLN
jgi:hypothetical protein